MKQKIRLIALALLTVIMVGSAALADNTPIDPFHEASDYFKQTYIWDADVEDSYHMALFRDGDLGDDRVPVALICALAVLAGTGIAYVHKKRKDVC